MFNIKKLKTGFFCSLIIASSFSFLSADTIELKPNRDYILTETRPNNIVLVDAKEMKIANNCKIDESFSPGGIVLATNNKYAFVLGGYAQEIGGYDITTCKKIFHTNLTQGMVKGSSLSGIAVSEDSKKVYAIYNRTKIHTDRYEVLDPMFSSYNISDGLNAKARVSFKIPRAMSLISVAKDGTIFGIGKHLYTLDPKNKKVSIAKKIAGSAKKDYLDPDSVGTYILGQQGGDFSTLYYTEKYDKNGEAIEWYWGITSVDLNTKKIEQFEFTEYETLMFTFMRSPKDRNIGFGTLNDLTKFDLKEKKALKRIVLDHTYYINVVSEDGKRVYLGGCLNDIAIYDTNTLEKLGKVYLPGDMGSAGLQVFHIN